MENDVPMLDQSAEYYRLREGHERALALAAKTNEQRSEHLTTAKRYAALARSPDDPGPGTGSQPVNVPQRGSTQARPDKGKRPEPHCPGAPNLPNVRRA